MKTPKRTFGILLLASVAVFLIAYLTTMPPKSYRTVDGPSSDTIKTEGVFKPGGFIRFTYKPGIESIKGYKTGTVIVYPLYPGDRNPNHSIWDNVEAIHFGRDWGGSISGSNKSIDPITISHRLDIPNDASLAGQNIMFYFDYSITYPFFAGAASGVNRYYFDEDHVTRDEYLTIALTDEVETPAELRYKAMMDGPIGIISGFAIFLAVCVGVYSMIRLLASYSGSQKKKAIR